MPWTSQDNKARTNKAGLDRAVHVSVARSNTAVGGGDASANIFSSETKATRCAGAIGVSGVVGALVTLL